MSNPSTPTSISHGVTTAKTIGDVVVVSWTNSIDSDGDSVIYELSYLNVDNWIILGVISNTTYSHTIPNDVYSTTKNKYRVRAYDGTNYSGYIESKTFEIINGINAEPIYKDKIYLRGKS